MSQFTLFECFHYELRVVSSCQLRLVAEQRPFCPLDSPVWRACAAVHQPSRLVRCRRRSLLAHCGMLAPEMWRSVSGKSPSSRTDAKPAKSGGFHPGLSATFSPRSGGCTPLMIGTHPRIADLGGSRPESCLIAAVLSLAREGRRDRAHSRSCPVFGTA